MRNNENPAYGNWVPLKIVLTFLVIFLISCIISGLIDIGTIKVILIIASVCSGLFLLYMGYAYWLLWKNDSGLQRETCNLLIDRLCWNGTGKALDIGTGSGRIAIYLAARYPAARVSGIDYWGNPWTYSKDVCERNARIEGVGERVNFQRGSAVNLPFADEEFDAVTSNYVFHSIKLVDRISLIKEALRVLKKGGVFAFQDLFNKQFYGDMDFFYKEIGSWGLTEVKYYNTSDSIYIPTAMRINHMMGNSKIFYGVK